MKFGQYESQGNEGIHEVANGSIFSGPEHNREKVRRVQTKVSPKATGE